MSEQTRANGNKCWAVTGPKWSIFNSAHRQIHLHKESPITYNPSAERTSDLTSTFYAVSRPAIALWTWQIAYWSADVVANVLSARAAAATCPKLHGSPAESSASPIPTFQSLQAGAPPLFARRPPSSSLLVPSLSSKVWKGSQTKAICSNRQKMAGEAGFGPCDLMPAVFDPLKKQGQGKIRRGGKQTPAQHSDNSWEEGKKKKSNLHCFNPQGRLHSHGALTQQLVRKRSCKLTPRPSCFLTRRSVHMSLLHMSVTQQKSLINSILPRQRLATSQGCR